jgi:DNA polymerase I
VQKDVIEIILKEKNPEKAAELVKGVIAEIKEGKVALEDLVIYKGMTKKPSRYESVQAHVKAAMKAREVGIVYPVGSKIGFVVTKGSGTIGDRAYPVDLVEDFDGDVLKIKTKTGYETKRIDKEYYINNQIVPSVLRILERFGYNEASLKGSAQLSLDSFF